MRIFKSLTKKVSAVLAFVMCRRPHLSVSTPLPLHDTDYVSKFAADSQPMVLSLDEVYRLMFPSLSDGSKTPATVDARLQAIEETQREIIQVQRYILELVKAGSLVVGRQ